jgi:kynureninase
MDKSQFFHFLHGDRISFADFKTTTREFAKELDSTDALAHFRNEFLIPSKADLKDPHPEGKPISEQNGSPPS